MGAPQGKGGSEGRYSSVSVREKFKKSKNKNGNKMKKMILLVMFISLHMSAQTVYDLPFASKGNQIELEVANTSDKVIENISVDVESAPEWINFENSQTLIAEVTSEAEAAALFEFSVNIRAPVGEAGRIVFKLNSAQGDEWTKEINVQVSKPDNYELTQNYPNPFNPATKIEFVLPVDEKVTMKVYDMLGREVKILLNEFLGAGHHDVEFNASNLASGTYIYVFSTMNYRQIKKMMLVK